MQKRHLKPVFGFMLIMMLALPFSTLALENEASSLPENPDSSASLNAPPPAAGQVLIAPRKHLRPGMRPARQRGGEDHVAAGAPNNARESFRNKANRRRDGLVSRYEQSQANKDPEDGSLADKAVHSQALTSKGEPVGKPAWMDNNPLKPATDSDSEPETKTLSAPQVPEVVSAANTQPITSASGNSPSVNPAQ